MQSNCWFLKQEQPMIAFWHEFGKLLAPERQLTVFGGHGHSLTTAYKTYKLSSL